MLGVQGEDERAAVSNVNGQSWRWFSLLIVASPLAVGVHSVYWEGVEGIALAQPYENVSAFS